jgi:Dolichyl-phosphate-mannose-protein mannosyltransferase
VNQRGFSERFLNGQFVWLLLALILASNFVLRWHLRAMPVERDEGEYAYAGQLLLDGVPPYQAAWNMKFPGAYFAYAALMAVFGQTAEGIHTGIILVTSLSIVLMFFIGRILLNNFGGLIAAGIFAALSALPSTYGLAGHATHLVVLFVCMGTFSLLQAEQKSSRAWLFVSGAAFGTAVLMKQHAAVFCLASTAWLLTRNLKTKSLGFIALAIFCSGILLPLMLTAAVLAHCGVWHRFVFWTIDYARQYVSIMPLRTLPKMFADGFGPIFSSATWIWLLGTVAMPLVFFKMPNRRAVAVGAGLLLAGLAAATPGFYFRGHYFLMLMPGLALLVAALLLELAARLKQFPQIPPLRFLPPCLLLLIVGEMALRNGVEWFLMPPDALSRKIYGANPFSESAAVAGYLRAQMSPTDTVAVIGSEPEIFFLAHRRSATGYIYLYPLTEGHALSSQFRHEFIREIEDARPRYVVYINTVNSWCSGVTPGETEKAVDELNIWWNRYAQNYQITGLVDVHDDAPSEFFWDKELANRTNTDPANLYILRRK